MTTKQDILNRFHGINEVYNNCMMYNMLSRMLDELLADRPEVVRCRDCEHATLGQDGKVCLYCECETDEFGDQVAVWRDADVWYCPLGERRRDG